MTVLEFEGKKPFIHSSSYVSSTALIIGDVRIKENASVWFYSVLRGDSNTIELGEYSSVLDGVLIKPDESACIIGKKVTIGKGSILEGVIIEEGSVIGAGSIILENARVGRGSFVAAGSLVPQYMIIPENSIVMGNPAKVVGEVKPQQRKYAEESWRKSLILKDLYKNIIKI
ncbi:MAG: gamma carbonic anhydrase family protein [Nitrososphaeria archaeon]|jgi:carbonic anhydrase/acetyltransferase-like protein (isoleucine patch superfamily)|nr:gamma carbonic anhydrase family protein [Nitrososphaerota archaeon]